MSVGTSVGHISELRAVFTLLLLPNRPRLDCRVSGLVQSVVACFSQYACFGFKLIKLYSVCDCVSVCDSMSVSEWRCVSIRVSVGVSLRLCIHVCANEFLRNIKTEGIHYTVIKSETQNRGLPKRVSQKSFIPIHTYSLIQSFIHSFLLWNVCQQDPHSPIAVVAILC